MKEAREKILEESQSRYREEYLKKKKLEVPWKINGAMPERILERVSENKPEKYPVRTQYPGKKWGHKELWKESSKKAWQKPQEEILKNKK